MLATPFRYLHSLIGSEDSQTVVPSTDGFPAVNVHDSSRPSRPHTLRGRTETWYCAPAAKYAAETACATDAGREGELIFRLIYQQARCKKPVDRLKLYEKLDLFYKMSYFTRIELKRGTGYETLYAQEILYAEADDKRVILHLADRDESFNYLLGELEQILSGCGLFFRIHRSYIVNMLYVKRYDASAVVLKNGVQLPLKSRGFKEKYQNFIFSQHR